MNQLAATPIVYVVDDDPALCKAVQWLLESVDLTVKTFEDPLLFLQKFNPSLKGCLLFDVRMPHISGLELQERLKSHGNTMPIILMSGHSDIPIAVRAMKAGALDFITKPFNDQHLIELVQNALQLNQRTQNNNSAQITSRYATLTEREREVLKHVVAGKMNKVIASEMQISIKTVELHRGNVMQKMQVKSLAELVRCYLQINPI